MAIVSIGDITTTPGEESEEERRRREQMMAAARQLRQDVEARIATETGDQPGDAMGAASDGRPVNFDALDRQAAAADAESREAAARNLATVEAPPVQSPSGQQPTAPVTTARPPGERAAPRPTPPTSTPPRTAPRPSIAGTGSAPMPAAPPASWDELTMADRKRIGMDPARAQIAKPQSRTPEIDSSALRALLERRGPDANPELDAARASDDRRNRARRVLGALGLLGTVAGAPGLGLAVAGVGGAIDPTQRAKRVLDDQNRARVDDAQRFERAAAVDRSERDQMRIEQQGAAVSARTASVRERQDPSSRLSRATQALVRRMQADLPEGERIPPEEIEQMPHEALSPIVAATTAQDRALALQQLRGTQQSELEQQRQQGRETLQQSAQEGRMELLRARQQRRRAGGGGGSSFSMPESFVRRFDSPEQAAQAWRVLTPAQRGQTVLRGLNNVEREVVNREVRQLSQGLGNFLEYQQGVYRAESLIRGADDATLRWLISGEGLPPGLAPDAANNLRSAWRTLQLLRGKQLSGAAVSESERDMINQGLGALGRTSDPAQLRRELAALRDSVELVERNAFAGVSDEAVAVYMERMQSAPTQRAERAQSASQVRVRLVGANGETTEREVTEAQARALEQRYGRERVQRIGGGR